MQKKGDEKHETTFVIVLSHGTFNLPPSRGDDAPLFSRAFSHHVNLKSFAALCLLFDDCSLFSLTSSLITQHNTCTCWPFSHLKRALRDILLPGAVEGESQIDLKNATQDRLRRQHAGFVGRGDIMDRII